MNPLRTFIIPVKGLKNGIHEFSFELDDLFFDSLNEDNEIKATLKANVSFDKRDSMYLLDIEVSGTRQASCDRCLENINIPVYGEHKLIVKRGVGEEDADLVYVEDFDENINIAKFIYDYAILSLPLMNIIEDCEELKSPPCNFKMLEKWESNNQADDEEENESSSSIWDELNNLNLDNKK